MRMVLHNIAATGGFLENVEVEFTPGLNCLIGARGTCKSTIVESIRFAFDHDHERIKILTGNMKEDHPRFASLASFNKMINGTLKKGSVRCGVRDLDEGDSHSYSIERSLDSESRIYRDGVKDHTDSNILEQIEIYSQGDLQRIANAESERLKLIDRPNALQIRKLRQEQTQIGESLRALGRAIYDTRARLEQLKPILHELPQFHKQLQQVQSSRPEFSRELDEERELFQRRRVAFHALQNSLQARDAAVNSVMPTKEQLDEIQAALEQIEQQHLPETDTAIHQLGEVMKQLRSLLSQASMLHKNPLEAVVRDFKQEVTNRSERYYFLRQQEKEANEALKKEDDLKQKIQDLEGYKQEMEDIDSRLSEKYAERQTLRQKFQMFNEEIFQLRMQQVDTINEHHTNVINLNLEPGCQGHKYIQEVHRLLNGSRLHGQEDLARQIASTLMPSEVIDYVEAGDAQELARVLNRDLGQVTRLLSFLMDNPGIYTLEGYHFEDKLTITMYDKGKPKPVENLSNGQKATALLPLILREAAYPLIFDQPEDDLDNSFIFHSLVQAVRELKPNRQIIFVTHNANIPVIGEAENVVVMGMESDERAAKPLRGSVDDRKEEIVNLLEGGADAFMERQRRYQGLI